MKISAWRGGKFHPFSISQKIDVDSVTDCIFKMLTKTRNIDENTLAALVILLLVEVEDFGVEGRGAHPIFYFSENRCRFSH